MRAPRFSFLFLLTACVSVYCSALAQVNDTASGGYTNDSTQFPTDTTARSAGQNPRDSGKFRLNPDSTYATQTQSGGMVKSEVIYTAEDSIMGGISSNIMELYNKAVVEYENIKLEAGYIRIDFKKSELYAEGIKDTAGKLSQKPIFTESGKQYRANTMRYNFNTEKAKLHKIITQEGDGFLHGEEVKKMDDETFYIRNASYTTCSHEHPHFRIITPKAKVIGNKKIVTRFAYLELIDVPTPLMVPFGFFPTSSERQSGILIPSYGNSQFRGYFLKDGGYYWAINDYLDLTLQGDIYTQGGFGVLASTNYKKRYKFNGSLSFDYDLLKFGRPEFAEFVRSAFSNQRNFSLRWNHSQDAKAHPTNRFSANVNIASSSYNQVTQTQPQNVLQNRLNSSISFSKNWQGKPFNLNVTLNHAQNNKSKNLSLTLPNFNFSMNRFTLFERKSGVGDDKWYEKINIGYQLNGRNQINTTLDSDNILKDILTEGRAGLQHSIPINANYKILNHMVFNPSINFTERWYPSKLDYRYDEELQKEVADTLEGFFANRDFRMSANFNTTVYGLWRYKGNFLKALRHKLTPTIGFSYRPDFSTDFWGYYEEVQVDSLGKTRRLNQYRNGVFGSAGAGTQGNLNFGIQNTLEAKIKDDKDSTGVRKVSILERFSVNTSYNMAAEEFQWSQVRLNATSSAFDRLLSMNYDATFDLYGVETDSLGNQTRVNDYAINVNNQLLRLQNHTLALRLNLNADSFRRDKKKNEKEKEKPGEEKAEIDEDVPEEEKQKAESLGITEGDIDYYRKRSYEDFKIPWNFSIKYNLTDNRSGRNNTISQSLTFNGNVEFTPNWRVGFSSGYDFQANDFTYTNMNFSRDLHCWQLTFNWVPFGFQQSYTLTIRVRSDVLSDLKFERRRGIGDFERNGF